MATDPTPEDLATRIAQIETEFPGVLREFRYTGAEAHLPRYKEGHAPVGVERSGSYFWPGEERAVLGARRLPDGSLAPLVLATVPYQE